MNTKIASLIAILTILIVSVVGVYARPINSFDVRENKVILPPTKLRADATSYNQVALKWKYSDNGYTFKIYRSDEGKRDYEYVGSSSVTSYTDNSVKADTKYFYRVKAIRKDRSGPYSNTAKAVTPVGPVIVNSCLSDSTNTIRLCAKEMNGSVKTAVTTNISGAQYSFIDVDNSLVGYWRMDNYVNDSSGYMTFKDSSSYAHSITQFEIPVQKGNFGKSIYLSSNPIPIGYLQAYPQFQMLSTLTISTWVNLDENNNKVQMILQSGIGPDKVPYNLAIDATSAPGSTNLIFQRGDDYGSLINMNVPIAFNYGTWQHIAVTVDDSAPRNVRVYLNGALVGNQTYSGDATYLVGANAWLGSYNPGYVGEIDEVMLFNRALTSNEVKSLYDSKANPLSNVFSLPLGNHTMQAYAVDASGNLYVTPVKNLVAR